MEREEEVKYLKQIQQGDQNAFELFYRANYRLITKIASKYNWVIQTSGNYFSFDDLISIFSFSFYKATKILMIV